MAAYQTAKGDVERLVDKFHQDRDRFRDESYNEEQVRIEFINPLFSALGWEVENSLQVIHEDRVLVDDGEKQRVKHPDYGFRTGRDIRFYVEAKKPSVKLQDDPDPAYQVRRYGWSRSLPLSVLTDFEEFSIYNCLQRPVVNDAPHIARLHYLTYERYPDEWDTIFGLFSREAVLDGALERYVEEQKPRGTITVDNAFLQEMEGWRKLLAQDIAARNPGLTHRQLNMAVQRTIDRLVFLRISEDRNIEPYGRLNGIAQDRTEVYNGLKGLYAEANDKYNSGLFHFTESEADEAGDPISLKIGVGDEALRTIVSSLYYPHSPYEFSVLPSDILGQVYERFLGSVIVLENNQATIEEKPEVRKAGGVYYTPTYIVDYIVEHTVGALLAGKNPNQVAELRILDPACGSGSFLIGAYQYLIDWHLTYYVDSVRSNPNSSYRGRIRQTDDPAQPDALTTDEKKRILLNNLYGVDLDQQAVEVTKLSLLLKMLEDETATTTQYAMFGTDERLLPDLADNIKWGNSLIGSDFYAGKQLPMFDDEAIYRVKAFDWEVEFSAIMGAGGFDAVIGNPPYGADIDDEGKAYFLNRFQHQNYQLDSYMLFIEQGINLLSDYGHWGMIIPNTWLLNLQTEGIRRYLFDNLKVKEVVHYSDRVFKAAAVDTQIAILEKIPPRVEHEILVTIVGRDNKVERYSIPQSLWISRKGQSVNIFEKPIVSKIRNQTTYMLRLSDMCKITQGTKPFQTGKGKPTQTPEIVRDKPYVAETQQDETFRPLLRGSLMNKYRILWDRNYYISFGDWLAEPRYSAEHDAAEKIIIRQTGFVLVATLDTEQFIVRDNLYTIVSQQPDINLRFVLGLLNSKFFLWFYQNAINPEKGEALAQVKKGHLVQLPIRTIDFDDPAEVAQHDRMVALVQAMLDLQQQLPGVSGAQQGLVEQQIARSDREIDALVYDLYGLTAEEIAIVEG